MYFDTTLQIFDIKVRPEPHPSEPQKNHLVLTFVAGIVVPTGEEKDPETGETHRTQDILPVGVYKVPVSPDMGLGVAAQIAQAVEALTPEPDKPKSGLQIVGKLDEDAAKSALQLDADIRQPVAA